MRESGGGGEKCLDLGLSIDGKCEWEGGSLFFSFLLCYCLENGVMMMPKPRFEGGRS